MRKYASTLSDEKLLDEYRNLYNAMVNMLEFEEVPIYDIRVGTRNGKEYEEKYIKEFRKRKIEELPVKLRDEYSGIYAEILHRMGKSESEIGEFLKKDKILMYQDGEERYFINIT